MLAAERSAGLAPEVNLSNPLHAGDRAPKRGIYPGFMGSHYQKSKVGISGPTKRTDVLRFFFKKSIITDICAGGG